MSEDTPKRLTPDEHRQKLVDSSYSYLMDHLPGGIAPTKSRGYFIDAFLGAFNDEDPSVQRLAITSLLVGQELLEHRFNGAQLKPILEGQINFPQTEDKNNL